MSRSFFSHLLGGQFKSSLHRGHSGYEDSGKRKNEFGELNVIKKGSNRLPVGKVPGKTSAVDRGGKESLSCC